MTDRVRFALAVLAAFAAAVALRTLSMYQSPLPFNPDGIYHAHWAATGMETRLPLDRMNTDDLHYPALLATAAVVTGVDALHVTQPVSAIVGAAPGVLGVAVARRLCRGCGWRPSTARLAGVFAGVLLAVEGLYLHRSMASDEQTVGLFLVPLALVAAHRAYRTDRPAWWAVAAVPLVVLPPLHNLEGVVAMIALVVLVGIVARGQTASRRLVHLGGLTVAVAAWVPAYHWLVHRYTALSITQEDRLVDVPGLALAWVILLAIAVAWTARARPRTRKIAGWGTFGVMFVLVGINAVRPIFPEMPGTPALLFLLLVPLLVPVGLAIGQFDLLTGLDTEGPALLALSGSVLALIGVAMTAALTPVYLGTAYRVSTFLHFPVLVAAGAGVAAVLVRPSVSARPVLRVGVACLVIVAAAASIPVAFAGLSMLPYQGVTTPGEYAAAEFATEHADGVWASDDHIVRVSGAIDPDSEGRRTPIHGWIVAGGGPPNCLTVVKESWTTVGAQFFPAPPSRVPVEEYRRWSATSTVVYHGGARDPIRGGTISAVRGQAC